MSNQNNLVKLSSSYDSDFFDDNPYFVNGRMIGELIVTPRKYIPPSAKFPAVSLVRPRVYTELTSAVAPHFHAAMRDEFIEVEGDTAEDYYDEFGVDTISGNDITLVDNTQNNNFLADLYEDALVHSISNLGDTETPNYNNWLALTGDNGIDYPITAVNVGTRTITVTGSIGAFTYVKLSRFRVGGDTGRVRIYSERGRAFVGAGATGNHRVTTSLRRRGHMQGHWQDVIRESTSQTVGLAALNNPGAGAINFLVAGNAQDITATDMVTDGTNGTPRTGKETNTPETGVQAYLWLGTYLGA